MNPKRKLSLPLAVRTSHAANAGPFSTGQLQPVCYALGEVAQVVDFGAPVTDLKRQAILSLLQHVHQQPFPGFAESVPAYTTLTVYYHPTEITGHEVRADLLGRLAHLPVCGRQQARVVEVPVCYEGPCAPDLEAVARHCQQSAEDVIFLHCTTDHHVQFLGFAPGLPYLGTLPNALHLPRKRVPHPGVPAGSVAIANGQTVIYPFETPAGWHVIGRTKVKLFDPLSPNPTLLQTGDRVRFLPVSYQQFQEGNP